MTPGVAASVHARLLNLAKARGEDFNLILTRYAIERFLCRLSVLLARGDAIAATFQRRETALPVEPIGSSDEFARDVSKQTQWKAFLGKNRLDAPALDDVIMEVRDFLAEPLRLARRRTGTS